MEAATAEFMDHGFRGASLRKIANRAVITTGALYTRYENNDVLFTSLVESALREIGGEFEPMRQTYLDARDNPSPEKILEAIRQEEEIYLRLLFKYYDQCILFFCRSDGSSVEKQLSALMEEKARQTVEFFRTIARREVDFDGVEFILSEQFHYYRRILQRGYTREKAISCMKTVEAFMEAGWKALFQKIL